jgi:thioredoxin 1
MKKHLILGGILMIAVAFSCGGESGAEGGPSAAKGGPLKGKVTFIELGSVSCIPCKAMQPIMDKVRNTLSDQVEVIFHDVWTDKGQPYASIFKIRVIPTQVFLDAEGREFYRHEGFLPEAELLKVLKAMGVKI